MGVGLQPLEFTECLADSPHFRDNLQRHEKELERTSQQIKRLIKEVKDVVQAAKRLGAAQLALAASMEQFEFACIGASMTEDERVISRSLHHFAHLIRTIEDERDRMLGRAHEQIIQPLERFRKDHIGAVKEGKKKFDKKTAKFCQTQERTLSLSTKKPDNVFQEADAALDMAERDFCQASLEYVFQLQAVQERKKFELVETLLGFVFGWWTFYHTAHDVHADAEPRVRDLQLRIQRTRTNFEETSKQTESLMKKIMDMRQLNKEEETGEESAGGAGVSRAGYLFLMEKKAFGTTTWSKQYATYEKASRSLSLAPYTQINVKTVIPNALVTPFGGGGCECVCLAGARACSEPPERRFCWEAVPGERERPPLTLQALSEPDRAAWLRAVDAAPPAPRRAPLPGAHNQDEPECALDDAGFAFVTRLIDAIEARGLEEQGLYRVAGVASKVAALLRSRPPPPLQDALQWETKTLTSALKAFLRALPDPLLTHRFHNQFIALAKCERRGERVAGVAALVARLPPAHREMLQLVLLHLRNVSAKSGANLMSASNLAVCFGPTLLRAERETVASILDLKFYNVIVETLMDHYAEIFDGAAPPPAAPRAPPAPAPNGVPRSSPTGLPAARTDLRVGARVGGGGSGGGGGGYVRARRGRGGRDGRAPGAGGGRGGGALLAAPPPAAAALRARRTRAQRRGAVEQQLGGVGVVAQRVPPAPAPRRAGDARAPRAVHARAHAVRVPRRERGRAVVRAEPDHHERGAVGRAGLAARLAQRQAGARARELRRAAALAAAAPRYPGHTPRGNRAH